MQHANLQNASSICVIGLGYIGLPTAAIFASAGHRVVGVDKRDTIISSVNEGFTHISEPNLAELVKNVVKEGTLRAAHTPQESDAYFICVPTPLVCGTNAPDISYVEAAVISIAPTLNKGAIVILESTSPVGTTLEVCRWIHQMRPDLKLPDQHPEDADIAVAYSPERVIPGRTLHELVHNDRVVGGISKTCTKKAIALYKTVVSGFCHETSASTAELVKLSENAFRDVNIAFANELSLISEQHGVNVWELIKLANCHPRVNILSPGPGVGGHCIAVDPWFIIHASPGHARLMHTARTINSDKPIKVAKHALSTAQKSGITAVACFGLSYKPDIEDLRESPSIEVIEYLASDKKMTVHVVDPHISELPKSLSELKNVELTTAEYALSNADLILFLVNHSAFKTITERDLLNKNIIDVVGLRETR